MFREHIAVVLILFLVTATTRSVFAQINEDHQKIEKTKEKIAKVGIGGKTAVSVTMRDGTKFKGRVTGLMESGFVLLDQKSGQDVSITYAEVKNVSSSKGLPRLAKIGLGIAIGVAVLIAVCYGGDQGCGYG